MYKQTIKLILHTAMLDAKYENALRDSQRYRIIVIYR